MGIQDIATAAQSGSWDTIDAASAWIRFMQTWRQRKLFVQSRMER